MGGKAMAKGMAGYSFRDTCCLGGFFDGLLQGGFVGMVATNGTFAVGIFRKATGGEQVLPNLLSVGVGVFACEGIG
jgi:hypothetical protein